MTPNSSKGIIRLALTGGIASGKSTVTKLIRARGVEVIDCDELVIQSYRPGGAIYSAVLNHFGSSYLNQHGEIDRKKLGSMIFQSEADRRALNELTHPIVRRLISEELIAMEQRGEALAIVDIPLLFETQSEELYDGVILVYIDEALQIKRLMQRNNFSEEEALMRIRAQMTMEDKRHRAHWIIDNRGNLADLEAQVVTVLSEVREIKKR